MSDYDSEENLKRLLKEVCKPVTASPEFENRLQKKLSCEVIERTKKQPRRIWVNPLLWASVATAIVLILAI